MTILTQIASSQFQKEVVANENFVAVSPAGLFARKYSTTSGLVWGYYGGIINNSGSLVTVADGTVTLATSTVNYIEASKAGVTSYSITANATAFTAGKVPLYSVTTNASAITAYTDYRVFPFNITNNVAVSVTSTSQTLAASEARADIISLSGTLTGNTILIVPNEPLSWTFLNGCTMGAYTLTVKTSAGTGINIASYTGIPLFCNGTNVYNAGQSIPLPLGISSGGTGATDSTTARANLNAETAGQGLVMAIALG